jgi:hypothetical protein
VAAAAAAGGAAEQGNGEVGKVMAGAVAGAAVEGVEEEAEVLLVKYGYACAMPGVTPAVAKRNAAAVAKHMMRRRHSVGVAGGQRWDISTHQPA